MATRTITRYRTRTVRAKRRSKAGFTVPIAPLAGLAVGMMPVIQEALRGNYDGAIRNLQYKYTPWNPWDNKFDTRGLWGGLVPLAAGVVIHKVVGGKLGVNRALAGAGVPFIRI